MNFKLNKLKMSILFIILLSAAIYAAQLNSSNYKIDSIVTSSGGTNVSSVNYQNNILLGTITGNISSTSYQNYLGFWHLVGVSVAPNTTFIEINSTNKKNYTDEDLTCYANVTDVNNPSTLSVNHTWYKNKLWNLSGNISGISLDATILITTLGSGNTTRGDNWTCSLLAYDGINYDGEWENATLTILNALPTQSKPKINTTDPTLNDTTTNVTCDYLSLNDADGDSVSAEYLWFNNTIPILAWANASYINSSDIAGNQNFTCQIATWDGTAIGNISNTSTLTIRSTNTAPTATNAIISSTDSQNRTNGTLTGSWTFSDDDADNPAGNETKWFKDSVPQSGLDDSITVGSGSTSKGEAWIFSVRVYDGTEWGAWVNSSALTILNTLPTQVTLSSPEVNSTGINRTPTFSWTTATDADNDQISYFLTLERLSCADKVCNADQINITGISSTSYTLAEYLDVDSPYNWSVTAYEDAGEGPRSSVTNHTVGSLQSISLTTSTVDFATLIPGQVENTTTDSPSPLTIENSGNIKVNLTIYANQSLWVRQALGTPYFRFMAGNSSTEANSVNWTGSQTEWDDISDEAKHVVKQLNYNASKNLAEIETLIEVPSNEPPGTKVTGLVILSKWS